MGSFPTGIYKGLQALVSARRAAATILTPLANNRLNARLHAACRSFRVARGGNTAVTFALAFIPLMGLVGAAIDYSVANAIKTSMQAATDSTALAIAPTASSQTAASLQSSATNF